MELHQKTQNWQECGKGKSVIPIPKGNPNIAGAPFLFRTSLDSTKAMTLAPFFG